MQICASLSCLASSSIILLFLCNSDLLKTTFTKLIFYIAISDLFSSIGIALGFSYEGTIKCYLQGILTNIFPISGIFWTTVIAYLLAMSIFQRHIVTSLNYQVHAFCWGFPVIITFLPLITNDIGPEDEGQQGWCFLNNRPNSPSWSLLFWTIVSFYLWLWASMIIFCLLFLAIVYETYRIFRVSKSSSTFSSQQLSTSSPTYSNIRHSFYRFGWYPLNVLICWFIPTLYDILDAVNRGGQHAVADDEIFGLIANCSPGLLGLLNVVAFISTNHHIRLKVWSLLGVGQSDDEQPIVTTDRSSTDRPTVYDPDRPSAYDSNRETDLYVRQNERAQPTPVPSSNFYTTSSSFLRSAGSVEGITMSNSVSVAGSSGHDEKSVGDGSWAYQPSNSITCLSDGIAPFHQRDSDNTRGIDSA